MTTLRIKRYVVPKSVKLLIDLYCAFKPIKDYLNKNWQLF